MRDEEKLEIQQCPTCGQRVSVHSDDGTSYFGAEAEVLVARLREALRKIALTRWSPKWARDTAREALAATDRTPQKSLDDESLQEGCNE